MISKKLIFFIVSIGLFALAMYRDHDVVNIFIWGTGCIVLYLFHYRAVIDSFMEGLETEDDEEE